MKSTGTFQSQAYCVFTPGQVRASLYPDPSARFRSGCALRTLAAPQKLGAVRPGYETEEKEQGLSALPRQRRFPCSWAWVVLAIVSQLLVIAGGWRAQCQYSSALRFWLATEGLLAVGLHDARTMYFSKGWLLIEALLAAAVWPLFPFVWQEHIPGALLCLMLPVLVRSGGLGTADVWMICGMALVLNWNQMAAALLVAIGIGLLHILLGRRTMTPFMLGLSAGCLMVLMAWEQLLAPLFSIIGL